MDIIYNLLCEEVQKNLEYTKLINDFKFDLTLYDIDKFSYIECTE